MGRRLAAAAAVALVLSGCAGMQRDVGAGLRAYNAGLYDEAYRRWQPAAQAGNPDAQFNMGLLWQQGLSANTPKNPDQAAQYFYAAAQQGHIRGMLSTA